MLRFKRDQPEQLIGNQYVLISQQKICPLFHVTQSAKRELS